MGTSVLLTLWGTKNKLPPPGVFLLGLFTTHPSTTTEGSAIGLDIRPPY